MHEKYRREVKIMDKKKRNQIGRAAVVLAALAAFLIYCFVPSVNRTMHTVLAAFASGDFTVVKDFVESYGAYAAAEGRWAKGSLLRL